MARLDVNRTAKFVVLARSTNMLLASGVEDASKALKKMSEFGLKPQTAVEVIDIGGNSFTAEQLIVLAHGER